jgi:hypothetical protein
MKANVRVYAVRSSKIKRISTRKERNHRFLHRFSPQVREKSVILRFKAKGGVLSLAPNSDGHKHFVGCWLIFISSLESSYITSVIIG